MINNTSIKTSVVFIFLTLLWSCGYQPILNEESRNFSISKFNLEGNKRLGGLLKNNLVSIKKDNNVLVLNIKSEKKTAVANKNHTGKILTYSVTLNFEISAIEDKNILFSKVYTKTQNFSASDVHTDTLNNEKKIVESLIESVANEIQIELNSIYQK